MRSLDVLVPSFRLDAGPLLATLGMRVPEGTQVRWVIVADDPEGPIPSSVAAKVDGTRVRLIRNSRNLGSGGARNVALDASDAEWVLFLDDDVTPSPDLLESYSAAVGRQPDALGFFGPTRFMPATTVYQRGVEVSDILTFFRIASWMRALPWAPTSNVLVRGVAARSERFLTDFPKGGGGEDIDYLLRVSTRTHGEFLAVPEAVVDHPWWFGGRRDYSRFARWSYGDSLLHDLHPQHCYRSAPNAIEGMLLGVPAAAIAGVFFGLPLLPVWVVVGIVVGELVVEFLRLAALKGYPECLFCLETVLIRSSNDVGRVVMQLRLGRWRGLTERWDHFCNGEHIAYHQRWAARKFFAHAVITGALVVTNLA
jgi:hypothetical protein